MSKIFIKILGMCLVFCTSLFGDSNSENDHIWLHWQFVGTDSIRENVNAKTIKEVCDLPQSHRLSSLFIERIVQILDRKSHGFDANVASFRQQLLMEFVKRILKNESIGVVGGEVDSPFIALGIRFSEADREDWNSKMKDLFQRSESENSSSDSASDSTSKDVSKDAFSLRSHFVEKGDWILFSIGIDALSILKNVSGENDFEDDHKDHYESEDHVFEDRKDEDDHDHDDDFGNEDHDLGEDDSGQRSSSNEDIVLFLKGDLAKLTLWITKVSLPSLPDFSAIFKAEKDGVRTEASLYFEQSISSALPEWRVPHQLISEPIVSFSAARGMSNIISDFPFIEKIVKKWGKERLPDQFFSWSRSSIVSSKGVPIFPMYLGWMIDEDEIPIGDLAKGLPEILGEGILKNARLLSIPKRNELILAVIPSFIQPFIRGMSLPDGGARIAGLFPLSETARPAPEALFEQLHSREKIVYYQWEITQRRIETYKVLLRFFAFLLDKPQGGKQAMGFEWLSAIESKMGNAATIITAPEPKRWELIRKSHFGLTGLELTILARWLESESFPWIDLSNWKMRSFSPLPIQVDAEAGR